MIWEHACIYITVIPLHIDGGCLLQDNEDCGQPTISPFHGHRIPQISMGDYVMRISKYSKCSNICCVMAYSYMQRLAKVKPHMPCTEWQCSHGVL